MLGEYVFDTIIQNKVKYRMIKVFMQNLFRRTALQEWNFLRDKDL
jgi:hypothetical protein